MDPVNSSAPEFEYDLRELPPSRVPFRRWRFELWHGMTLLRTGWRISPRDAERALRTAASQRSHDMIGVKPLRPENNRALNPFKPGATVTLDCGAVRCVLTPRRADEQSAAA